MCESGLGDFFVSDVQPLLLFKQCSMWLHEGLRVPEQPAIVPRTPGSLPTYPPCVLISLLLFCINCGLFLFLYHKQKWHWYHKQPQHYRHYPRKTPTRWSSAGPATNNSRTFGTTSRFHHLKPVADGTPQKNGCVHDHDGVELMDEYLILFDRSVDLGWWYTKLGGFSIQMRKIQ